jgi:hypothetical protein
VHSFWDFHFQLILREKLTVRFFERGARNAECGTKRPKSNVQHPKAKAVTNCETVSYFSEAAFYEETGREGN